MRKKKVSPISRLTCKLFGHKVVYVFQDRYRGFTNHSCLNRKGGRRSNNGKYVGGFVTHCDRCGKKVSNFKRIW